MFTIPAAGPCSAASVRRRWLRWPLPALAAWALAWALFLALRRRRVALAGDACGHWPRPGLGRFGATRMRKAVVAGGFPLSLLASGVAAALPAWAWLLPLALLWLLYPRRAWRDAPLFPTPAGALDALGPGAAAAAGRARARCRLRPGPRPARAAPRLSACPARGRGMELAAGAVGPRRAARRPRCAVATCGPAAGRTTTWSTCSSAPRACRARWTRRAARCAAAPGWPAWSSRPPAGIRSGTALPRRPAAVAVPAAAAARRQAASSGGTRPINRSQARSARLW